MDVTFPTPWQRIARAAELGVGVVLDSEEVCNMAADPTFGARAETDAQAQERARAAYLERHPAAADVASESVPPPDDVFEERHRPPTPRRRRRKK